MPEYPYQNNYPLIDVELIGKEGKKFLAKALIDSGADFSLFSSEIGEYLGIEIKKGQRLTLYGIGGKIRGYLHSLPLKVEGEIFNCKIVFSNEIGNVAILGRNNFFYPFLITFNEKDKKIFIKKHK